MLLLVKPAGLNPPESTNPKSSRRLARGHLLSDNCVYSYRENVETLKRIRFFVVLLDFGSLRPLEPCLRLQHGGS